MVQTLDTDVPDSARTYSQGEKDALTANLNLLQTAVCQGVYAHLPLDTKLLLAFHQSIFTGVRGHAGKHRSRYFGSEFLVFGPHRSCHRSDVETRLVSLYKRVEIDEREVVAEPDHEEYDLRAVRVAARTHAELVKIHPFEDGNGRTARMVQDYLLDRFGLVASPIEAVRQEYYDCMDAYILHDDIGMLTDLYLRLLYRA